MVTDNGTMKNKNTEVMESRGLYLFLVLHADICLLFSRGDRGEGRSP